MIKNIVFDLGGVIVDLSRENAVKEFVAIGLADADTRLDKYHQTGIFQDLEEGKLDEEAFQKELGHLCGRTLEKAEVQKAWLGFIPGWMYVNLTAWKSAQARLSVVSAK